MNIFRRVFSQRQPATSPFAHNQSRKSILQDPEFGKRAAADINVKHNFAVQRFSRSPYDLKVRVTTVTHAEGFLATVEWRWNDPNRDGRSVVAVTSGINGNKKLAISQAYRAMLTKQKLLDNTETAQKEAVAEICDLVNGGRYIQAVSSLHQSAFHSDLDIKSVTSVFQKLWRHVLALHDHRTAELLVSVLERAGTIPLCLYDSLIQELVYLSDFSFAESILLTMASDRIRIAVPERSMLSAGDGQPNEMLVDKWKRWRSLIALEELANIHAALKNRDQLPSFQMAIEMGTSIPLIRLRRSDSLNDTPSSIPTDSLVLLSSSSGTDDVYLTGRVTDSSIRPDGQTVVSVSLLTEERENALFLCESLDVTVLSESRITFERINKCMGEFFSVTTVGDASYRFDLKLRKLLLQDNAAHDKKIQSSVVAGTPPNLGHEKMYLNLSENQLQAVVHAMTHPLTAIHGPAGTGKTHTLCGVVSGWRQMRPDSRILCCADSNAAADNIFEALKKRKISAFRLGTWKALSDVPEDVLNAIPNKALVDKYRSAIFAHSSDPIRNRGFLIGARRQIEEEAVRVFKVVVTTLSSARNSILDKSIFPNVIIDEAAQTIEPATLLAISHGCERLVLVGDHKQLPAVVLSRPAIERGLNVSLFERLVSDADFAHNHSILLNVQRRMHPSISAWPNLAFYNGQLEDHHSVVVPSETSEGFPWFHEDRRVVLVDTEGIGNEEIVGTSTRNMAECNVLADVIQRVTGTGLRIGVVVPYLAQRNALLAELGRRKSLGGVYVNTVEGFQGNERDIMVISTTRSNAVGALGFLDDDKRMNVMLTRARRGLVIVGDKETLRKRKSTRWSDYMRWLEENATVINHKQLLSYT